MAGTVTRTKVDFFAGGAGQPETTHDASAELLGIQKGDPNNRPLAMTLKPDGALKVGRFLLSPIGLIVEGQVSEQEWSDLYKTIERVKATLQWMLGDWVNMGEFSWGKTYDQMAEMTGLKPKTLRDYAYVARSVDLSIRIDILTFAHHQLVVALPPEDQQAWLRYAAENKLTVAQMREELFPTPKLTKTEKIDRDLAKWNRFRKANEATRKYVAEQMRRMADEIERGEQTPE